jgi:hypothetical protein
MIAVIGSADGDIAVGIIVNIAQAGDGGTEATTGNFPPGL